MQNEDLNSFIKKHFNNQPAEIEKLPQSGSDREYYRVKLSGSTAIATVGKNVKENETFIKFTEHFKSLGCKVPEVLAVNNDKTIYLQQDLGNQSLLNVLEEDGYTAKVYGYFKLALKELAYLQIVGGKNFDYDWCITSKEFGAKAISADLLYFKYYFLDPLKIPYEKERMIEDFEALSNYLSHVQEKHFMFRDFQSRNIMIREGEVYFIDYQGGMKGALQYDLASLLWQAKANLPDEWKDGLLNDYIGFVNDLLPNKVDVERFTGQYNGYVLIRLLQVLGAYGFRGLFERKSHFLTSIPLALKNLKWFLQNKKVGISLNELESILAKVIQDEVVQQFVPTQANDATPLKVVINSFSFIKRGYPKDEVGNGGGFVFDCRGILNPGRIEAYKQQTGRDKAVKEYLEQNTSMPEFLKNVFNIVDISVEDYLKRGFENLTVNFGCTGGQHRSVYAADALARHLRNKFKVDTTVNHLEQNFSD